MSLTFKIEGKEIVKAYLNELNVKTQKKLQKFTNAAAVKIQRLARKNCPRDQGLLAESIITTDRFTANKIEVEIGPTATYGAHVEFGTKPHMPPVEPLMRWAELHGMERSAGWGIAINIKKNGTEKKPYLIPAYNKIAPQYIEGVEKIIQELK